MGKYICTTQNEGVASLVKSTAEEGGVHQCKLI
jgi:hypothetical protein